MNLTNRFEMLLAYRWVFWSQRWFLVFSLMTSSAYFEKSAIGTACGSGAGSAAGGSQRRSSRSTVIDGTCSRGSLLARRMRSDDVVVLDTLPSKAAVDVGESKLHPAEVSPLGHVHVHGGGRRLHVFDHLPKDMILGRHHVAVPKQGQMALHGLDVGFRESVGGHADAILRAHDGSSALGRRAGCRSTGPLSSDRAWSTSKPGALFAAAAPAIQLASAAAPRQRQALSQFGTVTGAGRCSRQTF